MGNLQVRRKDGRADGNLVAGLEHTVVAERLEYVGHRRGASLGGEHLGLALEVGATVERGLQVVVENPLGAGEAAARTGVLVADDAVGELEQQIGLVHAKLAGAVRHGIDEKLVSLVVGVHGGIVRHLLRVGANALLARRVGRSGRAIELRRTAKQGCDQNQHAE